jgi:hypothetical protein
MCPRKRTTKYSSSKPNPMVTSLDEALDYVAKDPMGIFCH